MGLFATEDRNESRGKADVAETLVSVPPLEWEQRLKSLLHFPERAPLEWAPNWVLPRFQWNKIKEGNRSKMPKGRSGHM
jgi:hypothetical protein